MSQALYRKWRPQGWESVIGQQHVVGTLRNALAAGHIAHAYLFAGPRGTGKTSTARLLAKAVNCQNEDLALRPCGECDHCLAVNQGRFLDLIEIDAASNTSVDDVRDLRDKINFSPTQGRYKVYIIDEVHMLSTAAFNALLKTLEEPPPHAIFVLATTEVHKIPATVLSRCQRHEFRRIPVTEIVSHLEEIAKGEDIDVEPEAMILIARQATGAMRDAISLLDQLSSTGQMITLQMAQDVLGTAASQSVIDIIQALQEQQADHGLDLIHNGLDAGSDARQFARQIVDYLRNLLLIHMGNAERIDATPDIRSQMAKHANAFETVELLRVIKIFNHAANEARNNWQPGLPLEMAFIEAMVTPSAQQSQPPAPQTHEDCRSSPREQQPRPVKKTPARKEIEPEPTQVVEQSPQDQDATQTLTSSWPQILSEVRKKSPSAYGLLNSTKSRFMRQDQLILNFASDVLKDKMEKPEHLEVAQTVVQEIFQQEIVIQCKVDIAKRDAIPPGVDEDGMVAVALRDLGGELG
jgi:DNA polymerase-3 subunit gamma/tau